MADVDDPGPVDVVVRESLVPLTIATVGAPIASIATSSAAIATSD